MRRLLLIILTCILLGFGFGFGTSMETKHTVTQYGNKVVNNAGFTDGEMQLMQSQVTKIEAGTPLKNVSVHPIGIVEVDGDRLALFEADGALNDKPIKLVLYIEHYGIFPDSVGGVSDSSGTPLGVMPGKYDTTGANNG